MFVYDLYSKKIENGSWISNRTFASGVPETAVAKFESREAEDPESAQYSPDVVVAIFPFKEPDTFSFAGLQSKPMGISRFGPSVVVKQNTVFGDAMKVTDAILLDPFIQTVSVQSSKRSHQDGLNMSMLDPNNSLLSLVNPGDWIVCWMFDNAVDANSLRYKLRNREYAELNGFKSGLKFIGKTLAPRIQHRILGTGAFIKTCTLQASAFSELDAQLYYDPQINTNLDQGLGFMMDIAKTINLEFSGISRSVNSILAILLPSLISNPPRQDNTQNPNGPMRIPKVIGDILGFDGATSYMDVLTAYLGVQKYGDDYLPGLALGIEKEMLPTPSQATPVNPLTTSGMDPPVSDPKSSAYGSRILNNTTQFHPGIDYASPVGTPVIVPRAGNVIRAGVIGNYGIAMEVDHGGGLSTIYGHLSQTLKNAGDIVFAGQQIAATGNTGLSTGPHLHFEIRRNGQPVDPSTEMTQFSHPVTSIASKPQKVTIYPHPNIYSTGNALSGAVNPQIAPFNNVPVWSVLEQHLIPVANEMYSTLRLNHRGGISPHLIFRQIPFASDTLVSKAPTEHTAFRELPRWKVNPVMVTAYDTGKSNSMRVNYVQVQVSDGVPAGDLQGLLRATTTPRWDAVDISRNGLKAYITQVSATHKIADPELGQKWTDMVTDRMIGAHLKLSGNISTLGIQEPIATGDNLQYDGFVYHIEGIEHRVQVNPMTGQKSFSTSMAISSGVPASGVALPEIAIREFEATDESRGKIVTFFPATKTKAETAYVTEAVNKTRFKRQLIDPAPAVHTVNPAANVEED